MIATMVGRMPDSMRTAFTLHWGVGLGRMCLARRGTKYNAGISMTNTEQAARSTPKMRSSVFTSSTCSVVKGPPYLCFPRSILL